MGGAMLMLALLAAAAALPRAAAVKGLSDWSSGIITHYGGAQDGMDPSDPSFGTVKGSCGYGPIPKDQYPYFSTAALSPSNPFYLADELHGCGQCFQIQCADSRSGVCKTDSAGEPLSVIVMISDSCPECETDHVDVQSLVFAKMSDPAIGRIDMQYRRVECAPPTPMTIAVMDYVGAGSWLRLSVTDTGGRAALSSVAVRGGGSSAWQEMTNTWGATWELASAPPAPLDLKIVGDAGEELIAESVITQSGGIVSGAGATGPRTTFDAGVQFTITDKAYGKVQAFEGPSDPMLVTSATPGATDGAAAGPVPTTTANTTTANTTASSNTTFTSAPPPPSSAPPSPAASSGCRDVPTPDGYSCTDQKAWGKCESDWIKSNGYCKATCGACRGSSGGAPKVQASGRKLLLRQRR